MHSRQKPGRFYGSFASRPFAAKKDIEQSERMVLEAVQMVDAAMYCHSIRNLDEAEIALRAIRDSNEFKTIVKAYREDLLSKETCLVLKSELGKNLTLERIEMHINEFEAQLQQSMLDEQAQCSANNVGRSLQSCRPSTPTKTNDATPDLKAVKPQKRPRTPQKASPSTPISKADKLTAGLHERGAIELSPTGFVHFPRHRDDDDDWEHVSQSSTSKSGNDPKFDGKAAGKKGLFSNLFGM